MARFIIILASLCIIVNAEQEGNYCVSKNHQYAGKCMPITECRFKKVLEAPNWKNSSRSCGFQNETDPSICCPLNEMKEILMPDRCREFYYKKQPVVSRKAPYVVALGYGTENQTQWLCLGTVLSENFVITAAHCTRNIGVPKWVIPIKVNETLIQNEPLPTNNLVISEVFVHPHFDVLQNANNIALLKLETSFHFKGNTGPACLKRKKIIQRKKVSAINWLNTETEGKNGNRLIKFNSTFIHAQTEYSTGYNFVHEEMLYAEERFTLQSKDKFPAGVLKFESGAPQFYHQQVTENRSGFIVVTGVNTLRDPEDGNLSRGIYTKISHHVDWIDDILWS